MGGSKWIKAKMALGLKLNSCLYVPPTIEDQSSPSDQPLSYMPSDHRVRTPTTSSSSGLHLPSNSSSKSCKKICAICLTNMKAGHGHAIFTAECSHSFHFHCIASNVKHGKQICPVCREKLKEIPFQINSTFDNKSRQRARINSTSSPRHDEYMIDPSPRGGAIASLSNAAEPSAFDDDDEITSQQSGIQQSGSSFNNMDGSRFPGVVQVIAYPEVSAVPKSKSHDNFSVLINIKAPVSTILQHSEVNGPELTLKSQTSRAPVDLVTVLDVSGSMAGTKLALLKRAMGFVIQNLGPSDRLSVIAFSSTARRLFPLRKMNDTGKDEAVKAVNSLSSNGGTNIAEGLRKGAKVMSDRKWKNPVSSIILLSDGQDTYTINSHNGTKSQSNHRSLLPISMHRDSASCLHIPVHAFGFGADHDAVSMHSISETSGGTFSFIEEEGVIQDAFAQCIGGLLSVVVQELKVEVQCIAPMVRLVAIKSGSYKTALASYRRQGSIEVGDLYAEEEKDFLVTTDVPIYGSSDEMSLLAVRCIYRHSVSRNLVTTCSEADVKIQRPEVTGPLVVSMEVDRQRNRLQMAEAMAEARFSAEQGDLASAVSILEKYRKKLAETVSARAGDRLCAALDAELKEMQERMANQRVYETSGRAYVLSGLSSHSWQRATARGDSTDSTSLVQAYQTPSMVYMVNVSQTMSFGCPSPRPRIRPTRSFPSGSQPR